MSKNVKIIDFNYRDIEDIAKYLCEYNLVRDYRYLFSSKEWLMSYLSIYKPEKNFLVLCESNSNYLVLSLLRDRIVISGWPFNDYNGFDLIADTPDFPISLTIEKLSNTKNEILLDNLFETKYIEKLKIFSTDKALTSETIGLQIEPLDGDFTIGISKKIKEIYQRTQDINFGRLTNEDLLKTDYSKLHDLLSMRKTKLWSKRKGEYNPSFDVNFDNMIIRVCEEPSFSSNFYIDYCEKEGVLLAASLNFIHRNKVICYLRAHNLLEKQVSYGLILDYWGAMTNESMNKLLDLSRGTENYKYRLGAKEYRLFNFRLPKIQQKD